MLVGPSTLVGGYKLSALDVVMKSVNALSEVKSPIAGDVVYLTEDDGTNSLGLYEYDGTNWKPSTGKSVYVA
jgi:hypothetical protein